MISLRRCSRAACGRSAVATLTYNYPDSQVVLGPLSAVAEPNSYDLCSQHARGLSVPRGWEVIRLPMTQEQPSADPDDLVALANAVREAAYRYEEPDAAPAQGPGETGTRRRHLRVITDADG